MMSPTDIKYFVETAKAQHISRAAERLGITQPALSHCIRKMEAAVGTDLFVRSKKGVSLTPAGKRLFEQAQNLMQQWDNVISSVHDEIDKVGGVVRVGCHPAVAQYTLPKFLPELLHEYPKLKIQFSHGLSRHMTEEVISSKIDVAFAVNPINHPDIVIKELGRDIVTLWRTKDCLNEKLLMVEPGMLQAQDILKKLGKRGWEFDQVLESSSLELISQLLKVGAGRAILPRRVVEAFSIDDVMVEEGAPVFHDRICLVYKPEFRRTQTGQTFIRRASESF